MKRNGEITLEEIKNKYDSLYSDELLKARHDWEQSPTINARSFVLRTLLPYAPYGLKGVILDVGTGKGIALKILSKETGENEATLIGTDISGNVLKHAKNHAHVFCATATNLPFKPQSIDRILCLDVVEHIEDRRKLFKEFERVLKWDGYIFITTPNKWAVIRRIKTLRRIKYFAMKSNRSFQPYDKLLSYFELCRILVNDYKIEYSRSMSVIPMRFRKNLPYLEKVDVFLATKSIFKNFGNDLVVIAKKNSKRCNEQRHITKR